MPWRNVISQLIDLQISGCNSLTVLDVALAVLFLVFLFILIRRGSSPPGPFGVPFIGVAWQIPSDKQWLKFHDWISHYGTFRGNVG
ncbi:hypothetical protein BD309DRAFT_964562 [Dichomitus squalens]|nr:hypothetical protein BD309DRAFT_964562 [Dichomitus squalens]